MFILPYIKVDYNGVVIRFLRSDFKAVGQAFKNKALIAHISTSSRASFEQSGRTAHIILSEIVTQWNTSVGNINTH